MELNESCHAYERVVVESVDFLAAPSLTGDVDVSSQPQELPGPPLHGLLAPIQGAARVVLVGGAGEGALVARARVAGVPPRQDSDRTRPRPPARRLGSVGGETLDLGPNFSSPLRLRHLDVVLSGFHLKHSAAPH